MYEQGDSRIVDKVKRLLGGGIRGHYNHWIRVEWCRREVCVIHEGDVRKHGIACCEV